MIRYYKKEIASYIVLVFLMFLASMFYKIMNVNGIFQDCDPRIIQGVITLLTIWVFFKLFHYQIENKEYKITILNAIMVVLLLVLTKNILDTVFEILFVGLFEETIFRDVYLKKLREKLSVIPAILVNGLAFGLMHIPIAIYDGANVDGILMKVFGTAIMGMLLCIAYYVFRNMGSVALVHTYSNVLHGFGQLIWLGIILCFVYRLAKKRNKEIAADNQAALQKTEDS